MLALFIAVSAALALVVWAEWRDPSLPRAQTAARPATAGSPVPAAFAGDLPRIIGFRPGDVIELEIEGPLPRPEELHFDQIGQDARLVLDGQPALIFEGVPARTLRPAQIRFRSPQAA